VDVYVQHLRKKLGSDAGPPVIETVRGVGYRIPEEKPPT
jgi:DNA-binding response OmpR family regulator